MSNSYKRGADISGEITVKAPNPKELPKKLVPVAGRAGQALVPWTIGNRILGVDPQLRRLWVGGQRLHHGLTGLAVVGAGVAQLLIRRSAASRALAWTLAGGVLIAHDWKDRAAWFRRGPQVDLDA